jgi:hypothetical protein
MPVPMMRRGLMLIVCLGSLSVAASACSAAERLPKDEEFTVPISELSGLGSRRLPDGSVEMLAVADEANELVAIPVGKDGLEVAKLRRIPLPLRVEAGGSEFEGVTVDAGGLVHVLVERGAVASFRFVKDVAFLVSERAIEFPEDHPLAPSWKADENARAEGIAVIDGRFFIVKQEAPVALVELEDLGRTFRAGRSWDLDGLDDASDIAVGERGLHVVGAKTGMVCLVPVPSPERGPVTQARGSLDCLQRWDLPGVLGDGKVRWEGLAILPDGRTLAGIDRKKTDSPNLAILRPMR